MGSPPALRLVWSPGGAAVVAVLLVAVASVAFFTLRSQGPSRVPPVAFHGRRLGGRHEAVKHAASGRLIGLPYRTITLRVRSTRRGDADLLRAMAHLPLTRMVSVGYRAHDGSWRRAMVLAPRRDAGRVPPVISPHGRGGDAAHACSVWGDLPRYARRSRLRGRFRAGLMVRVGEPGTTATWRTCRASTSTPFRGS